VKQHLGETTEINEINIVRVYKLPAACLCNLLDKNSKAETGPLARLERGFTSFDRKILDTSNTNIGINKGKLRTRYGTLRKNG